jgi:hypothetical protein
MGEYPECEKMLAVKSKSQPIGEFIEWLRGERGIVLAKWCDKDEDGEDYLDSGYSRLVPVHIRIEDLLAEYFGIDLKRIEQEKRIMLSKLRDEQKGVQP